MARIRTIKPEFWSNEKVMNCTRNSRLLFIGIWNYADDAGRLADSENTLKAQIFPGDLDVNSTMVRGMIDELSSNGLLQKYTHEGRSYLQVTGWDHQKIDRPRTSKIPAPNSTNIRRDLATDLTLSNLTVSNLSGPSRSLASAPSALASETDKIIPERSREVWRTKRPSDYTRAELDALHAERKPRGH